MKSKVNVRASVLGLGHGKVDDTISMFSSRSIPPAVMLELC